MKDSIEYWKYLSDSTDSTDVMLGLQIRTKTGISFVRLDSEKSLVFWKGNDSLPSEEIVSEFGRKILEICRKRVTLKKLMLELTSGSPLPHADYLSILRRTVRFLRTMELRTGIIVFGA